MDNYILLLGIGLFCVSCNPQPPEDEKEIGVTRSFSKSYKPAVFAHDNRAEKIKALAPEIQQLVEGHINSHHIPGAAYGIVVDDELVVASGVGFANLERNLQATTKSSFRIASMTKSFTAMAILKLRNQGRLSLEDPVFDYIPELSGLEYLTSDAPAIDIENLLTMTAGLPEDNPWGDRQLDEPDQMLMDLIGEGIAFSNPPSYEYEYSNTAYALLGIIVSRVSGQAYQDYITENILEPLDMRSTYWEYDSVPEDHLAIGYRWEDEQWKMEPMLHDGSYGAMGGLITSIEDFSKYVSFHLSAWPPRNGLETGPVKRSTLREMQTPQFAGLNSGAKDHKGDPCAVVIGYGFGLGAQNNCHGVRRVSHGGALPGFGSNYIFYPEFGVGLMAFGNLTYTNPWPLSKIEELILEKVDLEPRKLPASDILAERHRQVIQLIRGWESDLESKILAENFYLDQSRENRMKQVRDVFDQAGKIQSEGPIVPENQLRGRFKLTGEKGTVNVFFTLSPENDPKVQELAVWFTNKDDGNVDE